MDVRMNAGYIITDSIHIGETEFVIGMSVSAPAQFVTWECKDGNNYYWGHYLYERMAAEHDLLDRASKELEFKEQRQAKKPKEQERER